MGELMEPTITQDRPVLGIGPYLCDELAARGISTFDLAWAMGGNVAENHFVLICLLSDVGEPGQRIGSITARQLAGALGVSSDLIKNLDTP